MKQCISQEAMDTLVNYVEEHVELNFQQRMLNDIWEKYYVCDPDIFTNQCLEDLQDSKLRETIEFHISEWIRLLKIKINGDEFTMHYTIDKHLENAIEYLED